MPPETVVKSHITPTLLIWRIHSCPTPSISRHNRNSNNKERHRWWCYQALRSFLINFGEIERGIETQRTTTTVPSTQLNAPLSPPSIIFAPFRSFLLEIFFLGLPLAWVKGLVYFQFHFTLFIMLYN